MSAETRAEQRERQDRIGAALASAYKLRDWDDDRLRSPVLEDLDSGMVEHQLRAFLDAFALEEPLAGLISTAEVTVRRRVVSAVARAQDVRAHPVPYNFETAAAGLARAMHGSLHASADGEEGQAVVIYLLALGLAAKYAPAA